MKNTRQSLKVLFIVFFSILFQQFAMASGSGTSAGLTFLEPFGARPAALGQAFTGVTDDIAAFGYNPATLGTLQTKQASFMYQKGLVEDSYGQFMVGAPTKNGGFGLSVGYYNGGSIDLYDGTTPQSVNAQKDINLNAGYARKMQHLSWGFSGKYLSSELINSAKATAYAMDLGLQMMIGNKTSLGVAAQNFGTKMTYDSEGDNLPRIVRTGLAINMKPRRLNMTLLLDAPYYLNEAELRPSVGLETTIGPMMVRAGYRKEGTTNEFTGGAGFLINNMSFDYAFGLMKDFTSEQRISVSMKFGKQQMLPIEFPKSASAVPQTRELKANPVIFETSKIEASRFSHSANTSQVYVVQQGDTLATISKKKYGNAKLWERIYTANKHLLSDPKDIQAGQKIIIP